VQLLKLVEFGARTADSFGFGDESGDEDAFVFDESSATEDSSTPDTGDTPEQGTTSDGSPQNADDIPF